MELNTRQISIILAALRYAQESIDEDHDYIFFGHLECDDEVVTEEEINELCEDLNCSD